MQKKIGIITFHNSVNYGAVMQAYALQSFLESNGYCVEIIDYVNEKINFELNKKIQSKRKGLKSFIKILVKRIHRFRKKKLFDNFNKKYLYLSSLKNIRSHDIYQLSNKYAILITGSDQVWNLKLTGNDLNYFLNFSSESTDKIAYAVSIGDNQNLSLDVALKDINQFKAISVREAFFQKYAKEKYNICSEVCCDPTLLIDRNYFLHLANQKSYLKEKYIFCFLMEDKPEFMKVAYQLANEKGYKVIDNKKSLNFFIHCSPVDFLTWIINAELILTDSFHGTVFSVIFQKNFIADKYDGNHNTKTRIEELLKKADLSGQFQEISPKNYQNILNIVNQNIDYNLISSNLKSYSDNSGNWLKDAIERKNG